MRPLSQKQMSKVVSNEVPELIGNYDHYILTKPMTPFLIICLPKIYDNTNIF